MKTITLHAVPDALYERLAEVAARNFRSISREVQYRLNDWLGETARARVRLEDVWKIFSGRHEGARATMRRYRQEWHNFLSAHPELHFFDQVNRVVAEGWVRRLYREKISASSEIATLRRIWHALDPDGCNPWDTGLRLVRKRPERPLSYRRLTIAEARMLLSVVERARDGRIKSRLPAHFFEELADAIHFAWHYGMRIGSLASLKWEDFRPAFRRGFFYHVPPKTQVLKPWPLEIPVLPPIREILLRRRGEGQRLPRGWLFPEFHERYAKHPTKITSVVRILRLRAGIGDDPHGRASMHAFRATFVTRMDEVGAPAAVTDSITGHAPQSMHARYSRVGIATKRRWLLKALPPLRA